MIATTWQARLARVQRAIANKRFEDVRALANSHFAAAIDGAQTG
jgi:hypothetical protein